MSRKLSKVIYNEFILSYSNIYYTNYLTIGNLSI